MEALLFVGVSALGYTYITVRRRQSEAHGQKLKPISASTKDDTNATQQDKLFNDANSPRDAEGRVHHLHIKHGEVAPRILSVGDAGRAERIATFLDNYGSSESEGAPVRILAPRGFVTFTGTYKGVPVSIIATGMGISMMDFVVREARACVDGPMAMIRYGTCGGLRDTALGTVVVADDTVLVRRDGDSIAAFLDAHADVTDAAHIEGAGARAMDSTFFPYTLSKRVKPDGKLTDLLFTKLSHHIDGSPVVRGLNATADSFYSSQGRLNPYFFDFNTTIIDRLENTFADVRSLEMETHHLLDLARCSTPAAKISAAGAAMVIAQRHTNGTISKAQLDVMERLGGKAVLEALIAFPL